MKKILVTGAMGFIGRQVLAQLAARGIYEIHAVAWDVLPDDLPEARWHLVDLLDPASVEKLMKDVQPELLMHFAWYTAHGQYWTSDKNLVWEKASVTLIQKFFENGGQRLVGSGTCAEYVWGQGILDEGTTPLLPATLYGHCKARVGSFLEEYAHKNGVSSAWGRIFFLYGPHEDARRLVPSVISSLLKDRSALCTHGEQVRDFLYVKDVASAFVTLLESRVTGAVNIASGEPVALKDIINMIGCKLDKRELIQLGAVAASAGEPSSLAARAGRLRDEVGWKPGYDLGRGLDETIDWWKKALHDKA